MILNLLIDNSVIIVIGPQVFPFMIIVKLVRTGVKISNSTNTISGFRNGTLTVLDCCTPLPLRLAGTCAAFIASAVARNPISVGAIFHFANQIYEHF